MEGREGVLWVGLRSHRTKSMRRRAKHGIATSKYIVRGKILGLILFPGDPRGLLKYLLLCHEIPLDGELQSTHICLAGKGRRPPPLKVSMQHATPASSIFENCVYRMFLNMSSGSIYPFGAVNSGNLGGGLLILVIGSTMSGGDLIVSSSSPPASIPFAFGVTCASKFNVPELLRLQNSLVYFLFIVSERLSGCGTVRRVSESLTSESWPLGVGLITLLGDFSSPDLWFPPLFFQKLMPEALLRLSPKIEAKLGVLGREDSP